ncbi:hypothetical protein RBH94_04030 [Aestuariibaculum sp. YM273]|uniref:hypothetical protein n=1 Tax=Aestuariibaculum sp. YM273 TaxID=3070659 RepID=UPI0027DAF4EA|nr:hypothetical protein [Aestuariibaculum sp. YM273]WMI66334.1 hypothetical protein RBH94_04030 [Aestuariibaculum sp. YM273]
MKELECTLEKASQQDEMLLRAVKTLKDLFLKIDYKYEELPEFSFEKMVEVLKEVNGRELTGRQELVLKQIMF